MSDKEELFEEKKAEVEVEVPESAPVPSIASVALEVVDDAAQSKEEEPKAEKPKKARKKRVLTDEQKAALRENLKRGRETSLANRKKKKQLKAIDKEEKCRAEDEKIFENLKKKLKPKELQEENERLKAELAELKKAKAKHVERPLTPTPDVKVNQKVETVEIAKMPTISEKKKPLTARQKMKLLRGL